MTAQRGADGKFWREGRRGDVGAQRFGFQAFPGFYLDGDYLVAWLLRWCCGVVTTLLWRRGVAVFSEKLAYDTRFSREKGVFPARFS